jgi:hypothetical protein
MGHARSGNSNIAWAGNMNDVGAKLPDSLKHLPVVPEEKQIELQVFVEVERKKAAIQFQNLQRAIPRLEISFPNVDRQEGQTPPARRVHNVPAGSGHSVHAMKGIGEERDTRPVVHGVPLPVA